MACGTVDGGSRRGAAACCAGPGGPVTAVGMHQLHAPFARSAQIYALKTFSPIAYVFYYHVCLFINPLVPIAIYIFRKFIFLIE